MSEEVKKTESKAAEVPSTGKKSNTALIVIIVIVVLLVLGVSGCYLVSWYMGKKVINNLNNGKVSVGDVTVDTNANQKWPSEIPSDIPEFSGGKIEASGKFDSVWTVTISNVTEDNFNNYKQTLQSKGWTIESEVDVGGIKSYSAKNSKGYQVNPMMTIDDNGQRSIVIGINLENTQK